jgi:hypothetical protein
LPSVAPKLHSPLVGAEYEADCKGLCSAANAYDATADSLGRNDRDGSLREGRLASRRSRQAVAYQQPLSREGAIRTSKCHYQCNAHEPRISCAPLMRRLLKRADHRRRQLRRVFLPDPAEVQSASDSAFEKRVTAVAFRSHNAAAATVRSQGIRDQKVGCRGRVRLMGSDDSSAAVTTMEAGLAMRSRAFSRRQTEALDRRAAQSPPARFRSSLRPRRAAVSRRMSFTIARSVRFPDPDAYIRPSRVSGVSAYETKLAS